MISIKLDIQPPIENLKYWIEHVEKNVINDLSDYWNGWARKLVAEEIARIFATGVWNVGATERALCVQKVKDISRKNNPES